MLPCPAISLSLPSIHDSLALDCRVYHPPLVACESNPRANAAIVAHPYAPLGGSYDDPVVDFVASSLLRLGFIVGTFNFRGASGSAGRTSWTAKPERADYESMVAFMAYYAYHIDQASARAGPPSSPSQATACAAPSSPHDPQTESGPMPILLQAGYSYGAMITTLLPPLSSILVQFSEPATGSDAAEIRLRAESLAGTWTFPNATGSGRHEPPLGRRVGGNEVRRSTDWRNFIDPEERVRKGVNDILAESKLHRRSGSAERTSKNTAKEAKVHYRHLPHLRRRGHHGHKRSPSGEGSHLQPLDLSTSFRPAYLLVSPLQGVITHLATLSILPRAHRDTEAEEEAEAKLVRNETLALFGDNDLFVAVKRLRQWGRRLESQPNSKFRAHEISSAGHFWVESQVAFVMRDAVGAFAANLLEK